MTVLSNVAVGFWFDWSNHFLGSLRPVSWLSPEEFLRGDELELEFVLLAAPEPALARSEASRARRWCFSVTELAGEVRRGRGWPRCESWEMASDSGIIER
jgi:hypothetical protein